MRAEVQAAMKYKPTDAEMAAAAAPQTVAHAGGGMATPKPSTHNQLRYTTSTFPPSEQDPMVC